MHKSNQICSYFVNGFKYFNLPKWLVNQISWTFVPVFVNTHNPEKQTSCWLPWETFSGCSSVKILSQLLQGEELVEMLEAFVAFIPTELKQARSKSENKHLLLLQVTAKDNEVKFSFWIRIFKVKPAECDSLWYEFANQQITLWLFFFSLYYQLRYACTCLFLKNLLFESWNRNLQIYNVALKCLVKSLVNCLFIIDLWEMQQVGK